MKRTRWLALLMAILMMVSLWPVGAMGEDGVITTSDPEQHTHSFSDATCTKPQTCACGATQGSALGHSWKDATCTTPKTCTKCEATEGNPLGHSWKAATCTTPKTCTKCDATEGSALGHSWKAATCQAPKTCSTCGATEGNKADHSWKAATCTTPKTCGVCGATEGSALGHSNWKAATCTTPKTCGVCGATEGSALGHSNWKSATCTTPKTCGVCGATEGSALGHSNWTAATCTTAKTCGVCGVTEGSALGHSWAAATCTTPKTCSTCGATEGSALGHSWAAATCTTAKTCSTCSATEGSPLGHKWKKGKCTVCGTENDPNHTHNWSKATCTSPEICSGCGASQGKAAGHKMQKATCTEAAKCSVCGFAEGKPAGHKWKGNTCTVCKSMRGATVQDPTKAPDVTPAPATKKPKEKITVKRSVYEITPEEMTKLQKDLIRLGYLGDEYSEVDLAQYITDDPNVRIPEEISAAIHLFEMDNNIPLGKDEGGKPTKAVVEAAAAADENEEPYNIRRGARYLQVLDYLPKEFDLTTAVTPGGAHHAVGDALQLYVEAKKQEKLLEKKATYNAFDDQIMDLLYSDYQVAIGETPIKAQLTEVQIIPVDITSATEADAVDVNGVPCFSKPCDLTITGTANPGTIINAYYMLSDDDGNTNEYSARKEVQVGADGTWSMTFDSTWVAKTFTDRDQDRAGLLFEDANDTALTDTFDFNYDFRSHEISGVSFTMDKENLYMVGKTEPGVSVVETGSQIGTTADDSGNFQLTFPGMMEATGFTFHVDGDALHPVDVQVKDVEQLRSETLFPFLENMEDGIVLLLAIVFLLLGGLTLVLRMNYGKNAGKGQKQENKKTPNGQNAQKGGTRNA